MNKRLPDQGGNQLLIILDAMRVRYVGRAFGRDWKNDIENNFIGGIGAFCNVQDEVEAYPCPYYKD